MVGAGAPAGDTTGDYGTTILLTSKSVPPFRLETGFQVSGINFYWPDQTTGSTPYPPLFSDGGKDRGFSHGVIDNIVIINAYDGMTTTPGGGSGDVKISNSSMWAYHYLFSLTNTGDSWTLSNNRFTPGPLMTRCNFAPACIAAANVANRVNAIFHITAGGPVSLVVHAAETFSWRYGILVDKGGLLGGSHFDVGWDGMGTLVDSSSGGLYAHNVFTGSTAACGTYVLGGNSIAGSSPCFNLGRGSILSLHDFSSDGSTGSWLLGAGDNQIDMNNVSVATIGRAKDDRDYYMVRFAAATNSLVVRNSDFFGGSPTNSHAHGIDLGIHTMGITIIQNCTFRALSNPIFGTTNNPVVLTGNTSLNTIGKSVELRGNGKLDYAGNYWDVPPTKLPPAVSN
jgi:hypothetical protein